MEPKLCATVFKSLHGTQPEYISELCFPESLIDRQLILRSASTTAVSRLVEARRHIQSLATGRFCVAGPVTWNKPNSNQSYAKTKIVQNTVENRFVFQVVILAIPREFVTQWSYISHLVINLVTTAYIYIYIYIYI